MKKIDSYLQEIQLHEDFSSLLKSASFTSLKDKIQSSIERKDFQGLKAIASKLPNIPAQSLYKVGKRAHPKFEISYKAVTKELSNQSEIDSDEKKDLVAIALAPLAAVSDDPKKKAKELVKKFGKEMKRPQAKQSAAIGVLGIVMAGAFVAGAFATLSMWPLLLGLVITAFAMMIIVGGS